MSGIIRVMRVLIWALALLALAGVVTPVTGQESKKPKPPAAAPAGKKPNVPKFLAAYQKAAKIAAAAGEQQELFGTGDQ